MNKPITLCARCKEYARCCLNYDGDNCRRIRTVEPTNADRIRSMSDGELAQFLMDSFACSLNCPAYDICDAEGACVEFLAKWLQQEADI